MRTSSILSCVKCGKPVLRGARFCMACGSQVPDIEPGDATVAGTPGGGLSEVERQMQLQQLLIDATLGEFEVLGELGRGGMARRIALARAMALDPEVIMYDEPFAGLDPISMGVAANLIRKLNDTTGATSLLVSHDVQECFAICDYAYLLSSQGEVVAHGRPEDLKASDHPEVHQFIGGEPDGPVRFHYPARPLAEDLELLA